MSFPFSESKSGPVYCPSEYKVTLCTVLSKRFSELASMREVSSCSCVYFSSAESMPLQFSLLPRVLPPPPFPPHLSEACVCKSTWARSWIKALPLYILMLLICQRRYIQDFLFNHKGLCWYWRKQQWSFAGRMAEILDVRWPNTFINCCLWILT